MSRRRAIAAGSPYNQIIRIMNNFLKNQIRRANCTPAKKVLMYIMAIMRPGELRLRWRRHATELQNQLNANNWDRHGFYVTDHHLCLDLGVFVDHGDFVREHLH